MTQPFADALTWVPKSRGLGATLTRAHDLARAQNHAAVTLEHLLLALVEDPDASSVLLSCNIDLLKLNASIADYVQQQPAGSDEMPEVAPALRTILEYAVTAARQSRRNEINGAIVLAAVIGEGKSEAARLLIEAGLKFQDTVAALKRTSVAQPTAAQTVPEEAPQVAPNGQASSDDDPITTARRRVAAVRSAQGSSSGAHVSMPQAMTGGNAAVALSPEQLGAQPLPPRLVPPPIPAGSGWTPPPLPQAGASNVRAVRMPPPVPPVAEAPIRRIGLAPDAAQASIAPWSDGAPPDAATAAGALSGRPSIETADLIKAVPARMPLNAGTTVEISIPRAAILAAANAASVQPAQGRGSILTRAIAVRLAAPAGGCTVENASPETQWLDTRAVPRGDDDVRWRWVVTPRSRGRLALQLSVTMRTVAADGMIVETTLPERHATVRVSGNFRAVAGSLAKWSVAALIGSILTLLASVGMAGLLGGVFR